MRCKLNKATFQLEKVLCPGDFFFLNGERVEKLNVFKNLLFCTSYLADAACVLIDNLRRGNIKRPLFFVFAGRDCPQYVREKFFGHFTARFHL